MSVLPLNPQTVGQTQALSQALRAAEDAKRRLAEADLVASAANRAAAEARHAFKQATTDVIDLQNDLGRDTLARLLDGLVELDDRHRGGKAATPTEAR